MVKYQRLVLPRKQCVAHGSSELASPGSFLEKRTLRPHPNVLVCERQWSVRVHTLMK